MSEMLVAARLSQEITELRAELRRLRDENAWLRVQVERLGNVVLLQMYGSAPRDRL